VSINRAFHVRGVNPARDQRGYSPPFDSPLSGARSKLRGIIILKNKNYLAAAIASGVISGLILFGCIAVVGAQAADSRSQPRFAALAVGLPQVAFSLVSFSPLLANGETVGGIAIYDDPTTQRPADYLEVFDNGGALVVVSWFDRFGIERLIVDRALVEGGQELEGVFVAVVNGEII